MPGYVRIAVPYAFSVGQGSSLDFVAGNCEVGQDRLTARGRCSTAANRDFRRALNLADLVRLVYVTQDEYVGYQHFEGVPLSSRLA